MRSTRKIRRVTLGAVLVTGMTVAPIAAMGVLSGSPAAASSGTHKAKLGGNSGPAVEPKVKGKFSCNSVSNSWALSITKIQVIGSDGITPWDRTAFATNPNPGHYWVAVRSSEFVSATISQDPATGLYQANAGGSLPPVFSCATGASVLVYGGDVADLVSAPGSLIIHATLS